MLSLSKVLFECDIVLRGLPIGIATEQPVGRHVEQIGDLDQIFPGWKGVPLCIGAHPAGHSASPFPDADGPQAREEGVWPALFVDQLSKMVG